MQTQVSIKIETETQNAEFGYWDLNLNAFITAETEEETAAMAEHLGCTPELIDALRCSIDSFADYVADDLRAIWKRLDKLEGRTWGHK